MKKHRPLYQYQRAFLSAMGTETDYIDCRGATSIQDIEMFDEMYFMGNEL